MSYTDGLVLLLFLFFFAQGWKKGFFRSILGPISLILGIILSYIHFFQNRDMVTAIVISIFAPFVIHLILGVLLKMIQKTNKKDEKDSGLSTLSRAMGGIFRLSWQGIITLLVILLIPFIPGKFGWLNTLQENIQGSYTYGMMNVLTGNRLPAQGFDPAVMEQIMNNPEAMEEMRESASYKEVTKNPAVQDILNDDKILQDIESKNYIALMKNEKILALMQDENLLKEFFKLQNEMMEKVSENQ